MRNHEISDKKLEFVHIEILPFFLDLEYFVVLGILPFLKDK